MKDPNVVCYFVKLCQMQHKRTNLIYMHFFKRTVYVKALKLTKKNKNKLWITRWRILQFILCQSIRFTIHSLETSHWLFTFRNMEVLSLFCGR